VTNHTQETRLFDLGTHTKKIEHWQNTRGEGLANLMTRKTTLLY
jgi:hypothetical protein